MSNEKNRIDVVSASSLASQPWWTQLHAMINESYLNKNYSVFPPTWTRLDPDPPKGAEMLARELGAHGQFAVAFSEEGLPIGCGGVLPYRGDAWLNAVGDRAPEWKASDRSHANGVPPSNPTITAWEICCFCIHPSQRGKGLSRQLVVTIEDFIKTRGADRLYTNYAIDETGEFWTRLGFEPVSGADSMLAKGFKTDPDKEGLRADIHFRTAVKLL